MSEISVFHDSHNIDFRNPFGAVEVGKVVKLRLEVNQRCVSYITIINLFNNHIELKMNETYEEGKRERWCYEYDLDTTDLLGTVFYYFRIEINGYSCFYGNNIECLGGKGQLYNSMPKWYQITVYHKSEVPEWYKEGIVYQIFVDRFCNGNKDGKVTNPKKNSFIYGRWTDSPFYIRDQSGNVVRWDFYGGNLLGVREKLSYLKTLGVTIIYLNPIFESPSCHKYDTSDYENVDSMFGNNEIFKELCETAAELNIRIILDGVFSHTGADSKYFNMYNNYEGVGAYQSLQSKYYRWYRFSDYPKVYDSWWGFSNMPNVDEMNPSYLEYIIQGEDSIIKKWLELGASGWRLDVADELPDEFIKLLKIRMREIKKDSVLIGEVWEDASNKVSYSKKREYLFGYELDSVTNYPLRQLIIDYVCKNIGAEYFAKRFKSLYENYPKENFFSTMNMLGNHDTERIFSVLGKNIALLKMAIILQMALPGVPLIYYGDEAGLTGGKDPDNRKPYPWGRENRKILELYREICRLRCKEEALKKGNIHIRDSYNGILCFERWTNTEKIIVIINSSDKEELYMVNKIEGSVENLIDSKECYSNTEGNILINLKANECKILKVF